MSISTACPGCGSRLNAPDNAAGRTVTCPKCKGKLTIPVPEPEPIVSLAEAPGDFEFNSKSRGSRRDQPRWSSRWAVIAGIGALVLLMAGAGFAYYKYREHEKLTHYFQDGAYIDYMGAKDLLDLAETLHDSAATRNSPDLEMYRAKREQRRKEVNQVAEKIKQRWGVTPDELAVGYFDRHPEDRPGYRAPGRK